MATYKKQLTAKQEKFVSALVTGSNLTHAAKLAGYSHPNTTGSHLMRLSHVVEAIRRRRMSRIDGELSNIALDTMKELMQDDQPANVRFSAARWILKQHGLEKEETAETGKKDLAEMDAAELQGIVSGGMQALSELASQLTEGHIIDGEIRPVVDVEHTAEPEKDTQELDFLT